MFSKQTEGTWSFDITGNMRVLCEFDKDIISGLKTHTKEQSMSNKTYKKVERTPSHAGHILKSGFID